MGNVCLLRRVTSDSLLTTKQCKCTRVTKNVAIMANTEQKQTTYSKQLLTTFNGVDALGVSYTSDPFVE